MEILGKREFKRTIVPGYSVGALAQEVQKRAGFQYKAGLWEEDMLFGLIWSADGMGKPTSACIAPSWIWASLDLTNCLGGPWRASPYPRSHLIDFTQNLEDASIQEAHIDYHHDEQFGQVTSGYLVVSGFWRGIESWSNMPERFFNGDSDGWNGDWVHWRDLHVIERIKIDMHEIVEIALPGQIVCSLDCIPGVQGVGPDLSSRNIIYFKIARLFDRKHSEGHVGVLYALMLEQVEGEIDLFRRIGIAQTPDHDGMTEGWPDRTIKII